MILGEKKPYAPSFSIGGLGVCVCLLGGVLDIPLTSFLAIDIGGDVVLGRLSSTCILSSLSTLRGLCGGDRVAIGGRAIDTSRSPRPGAGPGTLECPAPTGRGWGGRTTAPRGGGDPALPRSAYISWTGTFLLSGECEAGCWRNGIGDGLVLWRGGVLLLLSIVDPLLVSVLDRLLWSLWSLTGLLGRFSWAA